MLDVLNLGLNLATLYLLYKLFWEDEFNGEE